MMWLVVLGAAGLNLMCAQEVRSLDPEFKPVCIGADLSSKEVRPGGQIAVTLRFRNDGTSPAARDYLVYVHIEHPGKSCSDIRAQADHAPTVPMTAWTPGKVVSDGPHVIEFPDGLPDGTYFLHVGIWSSRDPGFPRLSDQYLGEIRVSRTALEAKPVPPNMSASEAAKRRASLAARISDPVVLANECLEFTISRRTGDWALMDKRTSEVWRSNPEGGGFGEVTFTDGGKSITREVTSFADVRRSLGKITLVYQPPDKLRRVDFSIELLPGEKGLRFSYSALRTPNSALGDVESVRLLDRALWATETERGYLAVPYRLGVMIPASEGLPFTMRYTAYSNYRSYSMAMFGAVKNGSALLVHWDDPYTALEVQRTWPDLPNVPGHGMVSASLILSQAGRSFVIQPLGKGGYAEIARAYREVARERGLLRTWREKIAANPGVESILGAADIKPFVLSRVQPKTRWNPDDKERLHLGFTFDEAARIAEHLKNDLSIDRAMVVLAGWIHRGYDNQHPDILPAAPECGGDDALADCSRRVKKLGYLFGLHDNYEDMYRDAPSWDESFIMKHRDGSLQLGGVWAGGQSYLTCSKKAMELAQRPRNLPGVKKLFDPSIYFIDTTFAAALQECFDPTHPITRDEDLRYKRELSEYARRTFGLFGSEEGQEWAVPCADYFEGLLSHLTQRIEGEMVIPLFEMVYGDCIALYTHQGDRGNASRPSYVLDHILCAEMPVYDFGAHLYFKNAGNASDAPLFARMDQPGNLCETDRFIKNTYEILSPLSRITAHTPMTAHEFLTPDRKVERSRFGDVEITVNYGEKPYRAGKTVLPRWGFLVQSPTFVAFYATEYRGKKLSSPTMLSAWAVDGKPLSKSANVRIHRAFGDALEVSALR